MNPESIDFRINRQQSYTWMIENAFSELIKVGMKNVTIERIETRIKELQNFWTKFATNDQIINETLTSLDSENFQRVMQRVYFEANRFKITHDIFLNSLEKMRSLQKKITNITAARDSSSSHQQNQRLLMNEAMSSLLSSNTMSTNSYSELERIFNTVNQTYQKLESLERATSKDDILIFLATQKFDPESAKAWNSYLGSSVDPPTWKQLEEFISSRKSSLQTHECSQSEGLSRPIKPYDRHLTVHPYHSRPTNRIAHKKPSYSSSYNRCDNYKL